MVKAKSLQFYLEVKIRHQTKIHVLGQGRIDSVWVWLQRLERNTWRYLVNTNCIQSFQEEPPGAPFSWHFSQILSSVPPPLGQPSHQDHLCPCLGSPEPFICQLPMPKTTAGLNSLEAKPPHRAVWCLQPNHSYWHFSCRAENLGYNFFYYYYSLLISRGSSQRDVWFPWGSSWPGHCSSCSALAVPRVTSISSEHSQSKAPKHQKLEDWKEIEKELREWCSERRKNPINTITDFSGSLSWRHRIIRRSHSGNQ